MGFLSGKASFIRFRVDGPTPDPFGEAALESLSAHAIGHSKIAAADGSECGWSAGGHIHDLDFTAAKNVIGDYLHFDLRMDSDKFPADKMKAYYAIELAALSANNPSGFASAKQKREAKEIARERLETEAKDGRFRKTKCVPVLWSRTRNEVWFGSTSLTHVDRLCSLFDRTFGSKLDGVTAGRLMRWSYDGSGFVTDPGTPSAFVVGATPDDFAWIADDTSFDWLGNEFALWLWWHAEVESDTVKLPDGSESCFMFARTLVLECPRGQSGHEVIKHEGPTRLPEAKRAIRSGKLPRKAGLTVVRHDTQFELTLQAETFALSGVKVPREEADNPHERKLERLANLDAAVEAADLLYRSFLSVRLGKEWADVLPRMQRWLKESS